MKYKDHKVSKEDFILIGQIVKRAEPFRRDDFIALSLDITAVHINGNPLRLTDWLETESEFDFAHDIIGIENNLNRNTGHLFNFFVPRFSK